MRVALFVPCFIDQLYPQVAAAALSILERLGLDVDVPTGAVCCGQPPANAGFEPNTHRAIATFVETFTDYDRVVVLSGSCALHLRLHAGDASRTGEQVAEATTEVCAFLHDDMGLAAITEHATPTPERSIHEQPVAQTIPLVGIAGDGEPRGARSIRARMGHPLAIRA